MAGVVLGVDGSAQSMQALQIAAQEARWRSGSRGFGGFRGLLLGSVSQQCVQHATCPVLVVRPHHDH